MPYSCIVPDFEWIFDVSPSFCHQNLPNYTTIQLYCYFPLCFQDPGRGPLFLLNKKGPFCAPLKISLIDWEDLCQLICIVFNNNKILIKIHLTNRGH